MKGMVMSDIVCFQTDWIQNREVAKKQIRNLIKEWKSILNMEHWTFEVTFSKEDSRASCYAMPEYRRAVMNFWVTGLLKSIKSNYELEEFVVHEMLHCVAWPLVGTLERFIEKSNDETGELVKRKEDDEELLIQTISDALVMMKYGIREIPDSIKFRKLRKDRKNSTKKKAKYILV